MVVENGERANRKTRQRAQPLCEANRLTENGYMWFSERRRAIAAARRLAPSTTCRP
jgi:hypothetical protein